MYIYIYVYVSRLKDVGHFVLAPFDKSLRFWNVAISLSCAAFPYPE